MEYQYKRYPIKQGKPPDPEICAAAWAEFYLSSAAKIVPEKRARELVIAALEQEMKMKKVKECAVI